MIKARLARADEIERAERRRAPRRAVEIDARVRELGTEGCEAKILNLSKSGFMAECDADFEVGARIWLLIAGQDRAAAEVRWTDGNRLGAEFAEPLDSIALAG